MNYIPEAHKISPELRAVRDLTRTRLRLVWKRTSCYNSLHRLAEKWNVPEEPLPGSADMPAVPALYHDQVALYTQQIDLLNSQIRHIEHLVQDRFIDNDDIQRLLWVPGIGPVTALSLYLEIDGIERFSSERKFFSYARLVPGANNSNRKHRHKSGNKEEINISRSHHRRRRSRRPVQSGISRLLSAPLPPADYGDCSNRSGQRISPNRILYLKKENRL